MVLINICRLLQHKENKKFKSSILQTKKFSKKKKLRAGVQLQHKSVKVLKIKGCTRVVVGCSYNLFGF